MKPLRGKEGLEHRNRSLILGRVKNRLHSEIRVEEGCDLLFTVTGQ